MTTEITIRVDDDILERVDELIEELNVGADIAGSGRRFDRAMMISHAVREYYRAATTAD